MKVFLTAEWKHLVLLTYQVPSEKLVPHLPKGVELDLLDGKAHVSLVAFDFLNTRVKGIKVPFHTDFPEVNLRFYVNYQGQRGVVFIREYVPKHCIAFIANRFYNEPYVSFPMESTQKELKNGQHESSYRIWKDKNKFKLEVKLAAESTIPAPDSLHHYFKEHELGFGQEKRGDTLCYRVEHPVWESREILELNMDYDFEILYGPEWAFLNDATPILSTYASGSAIKVYAPTRLETGLPAASDTVSDVPGEGHVNNDARSQPQAEA